MANMPRARGVAPHFTSIQAKPRAGPRGRTYELSWVAIGATAVELEGYGVHGPIGSVMVAFDDVPRRWLTAHGPGGANRELSPQTITFAEPAVGLVLPDWPRRALGGGRRDTHWLGAEAPTPNELLARYRPPSPRGSVGERADGMPTVHPSSWLKPSAALTSRFGRTPGRSQSWNAHFQRVRALDATAEPGADQARGEDDENTGVGRKRRWLWWR